MLLLILLLLIIIYNKSFSKGKTLKKSIFCEEMLFKVSLITESGIDVLQQAFPPRLLNMYQ